MEFHWALGEVIKRERNYQGLTQEAVARRGGLDVTYLRDIEHGRCNPSIDMVYRVATGLGIEITALITMAKEKFLQSNNLT